MSVQLDPSRSLGNQVRRCHRRFDRLLSAQLAPFGLDTGFWYYLRVLWQRDGVSQKYLSDATGVTENTTAALIAAMIRRGLVNRQRDSADRRKVQINLTPEGRALAKDLLPRATGINAIAASGISESEVETCLSVLIRMSANLEQAFVDFQGAPDI